MDREPTEYDKHEDYERLLAEPIDKLKKTCTFNDLPMFLTVAVANSKDGTEYESTMVMSSAGVKLKDNRIARALLIMNDFDRDYPDNIQKDIRELNDYMGNYPDYIQKDIQELNDYMDRIEKEREQDKADVELKDDKVEPLMRMVDNGDKIKVEDNARDDFWDELDES